jgi:hypothetical protein
MKTYRVYGEYIQKVYIDIHAHDSEEAQETACDAPNDEWLLINKPIQIDVTGVDYA